MKNLFFKKTGIYNIEVFIFKIWEVSFSEYFHDWTRLELCLGFIVVGWNDASYAAGIMWEGEEEEDDVFPDYKGHSTDDAMPLHCFFYYLKFKISQLCSF